MGELSFIANMNALAVFCFIAGFILVFIEMFHPGFAVFGITGAILLVLGIVLSAKNVIDAMILLVIILAILGFAFAIVIQSATKGKLSKVLVLRDYQKREDGYIGTDELNYFLGKEGTAVTILRPAGTADINGVKVDVLTEGEFISQGEKIKVIKVEGRRIVVRKTITNIKESV